jgi:hypothetical protein
MEICNKIINDSSSSDEVEAKVLETIGLIYIKKYFKLDEALKFFEKAIEIIEKLKQKNLLSTLFLNCGSIYEYKNNNAMAEYYWNKALEICQSIGNIEKEAMLLGNFGVTYYNELKIQKSITNMLKADKILSTLGNKKVEGKIKSILGEILLLIGDYQESMNYLFRSISIFNVQKNLEEELEASFILAKLFFQLGHINKFKGILNFFNKWSTVDTNNKELKDLKKMLVFLITEDHFRILLNERDIENFRNNLIGYNRRFDYLLFHSELIISCIKTNHFEKAYQLLFLNDFDELCKNNKLFFAEKNYLLGLLANSNNYLKNLETSIYYFEKASNILEGINVMELTWKVLYEMSKYYFGRGQKSKARNYAADSISLIEYFGQNIKDQSLKDAYFNKPERKNALEKLNSILL